MIHDYKLRPYHNPEGVDESKVPDGWRFRYADEFKLGGVKCSTPCKVWAFHGLCYGRFRNESIYTGNSELWTYIVPVTP